MRDYRCTLFCSLYKAEKYINGYLDNMLRQPLFDEIEFLFLDCASPENEGEIVKPVADKFENVKYRRLEQDPGLYAAWNIMIKESSAPILGNWNADDRKNLEGLGILLKALDRNPDVDCVYGLTYVSHIANEEYEDNNFQQIFPFMAHSLENLLRNNSPHCMPLWRKSLHDRFGYLDESYTSAADGEFWLRCAFGGAKLKEVNHPVGLYYQNPTGVSTNPEKMDLLMEEVRRSKTPYIEAYKKMLGFTNNAARPT